MAFSIFRVKGGNSPMMVFVALCGNHSTEEVPWLSLLILLTYHLHANLRVFTCVMNEDSE